MQRVLHGLPKRDWHLCQKVVKTGWFLPRRRYASSGISGHRMSVLLSHATIVPKRLYVGSWTQHHLIAQGLVFWRQQSLVDAPPHSSEICAQSDPPPFEHNDFDQYPLIVPQLWELAKKVQLALIGSRPRAFQRAIDEPCTLSLSPQKGGTTRFCCFASKIQLLSATKFLCMKTSSGKVVATSFP